MNDALLILIITLGVLILGFLVGGITELRHFRRLKRQESALKQIVSVLLL